MSCEFHINQTFFGGEGDEVVGGDGEGFIQQHPSFFLLT